jgi:hypothetical protein
MGLDVDEDGFGAETYDGANGAKKGVGAGDDFIARLDAERHHGNDEDCLAHSQRAGNV